MRLGSGKTLILRPVLNVYYDKFRDDKCDKVLHCKAASGVQPDSRSRLQGPAHPGHVSNCVKTENMLEAIKIKFKEWTEH